MSCGFIPNPPSTFARCSVTSNLVMRSSIPSRPVLEKTMSSTMAFIRDCSPKGLYRSDKLWSTNVTGSTYTPFVNPPLIRACGGMVSISSLAPPRSADATYAAFRATDISSRIDHSITSRVQFRKGNQFCMCGPHAGGPLWCSWLYIWPMMPHTMHRRAMPLRTFILSRTLCFHSGFA